jgi:hypothetical protein
MHGTGHNEDRWDWLRWSLLTWCCSCRESSASALGIGWCSVTGCFRWSVGSWGWPLSQRSWSQLVLLGLLWPLVLQFRLIFTCSLYEWYCWIHWTPGAADNHLYTPPLSQARPNRDRHCYALRWLARQQVTRSKTALWKVPTVFLDNFKCTCKTSHRAFANLFIEQG